MRTPINHRQEWMVVAALSLLLSLNGCHSSGNGQENKAADAALITGVPLQENGWRKEAKQMVDEQIRSRGVGDQRVLKTMEETPRHLFIPKDYRNEAYDDHPLPIGEGQTISQPYIVGFMTELLELKGGEKVLEIGTGSGYQAAILSRLVKEVYTIEIVKTLADSSKVRLRRMGYDNVTVKWGDGYKGWPEHAPFDAIIVTAAPDKTPPRLIEQLKPGGTMVLPVGTAMQTLNIITKTPDGKIKERSEAWVRFVPMVHPADSLFKEDK